MTKAELLKPVRIIEAGEAPVDEEATYTVSVVEGEPIALNDVSPVLTIQTTDLDEDLLRVVQAAEILLPLHRKAPGIIAINDVGEVLGVIAREDLEEAVLLRRRGKYAELNRALGLERTYQEPAGDPANPFVYWECPECDSIRIPAPGHGNDTPPLCNKHTPPKRMERHVHPGL